MKKRNKVFLIILTIIAFVGILNVHAAITTGSTTSSDGISKIITEKANLTVSDIDAGDQLSAYKILDAFYNINTNVISYEFTNDFKAYLNSINNNLSIEDYFNLTSGDIESGEITTSSNLDTLASGYASYIKSHNVKGTAMSISGTTAYQTLDAGAYLVLPTKTLRVYAVMVGNLDYTANGNAWEINNESIVAKVEDAGITKAIGNKEASSGSYGIGDVVPYVIKATVPLYPTNAINKTYVITDTISEGLDFEAVTSINITDGITALTNNNGTFTNDGKTVAIAKISGKTLTITFMVDNVTSNLIRIEYKATVNNNAIIGGNGNVNKASLEYSNDPYGTGTHNTATDAGGEGDKEVPIYVYGIQIFKHAAQGNTPLEGATFEIYSDISMTSDNLVDTVTTATDGYVKTKGLASGTYYIKETSAPTGYQLLTDPITVTIGPNQASGNQLQDTNNDGYYELDIANAAVGLLPVTGGAGTIILTIIGLAIIVGAFYFFFIYRRKKEESSTKKNN